MIKVTLKDRSKLLILIAGKGQTFSDFAKEICISNGYLSLVINEKRNPSPRVARKIATALDKDITDLFIIETNEIEKSYLKEVKAH